MPVRSSIGLGVVPPAVMLLCRLDARQPITGSYFRHRPPVRLCAMMFRHIWQRTIERRVLS